MPDAAPQAHGDLPARIDPCVRHPSCAVLRCDLPQVIREVRRGFSARAGLSTAWVQVSGCPQIVRIVNDRRFWGAWCGMTAFISRAELLASGFTPAEIRGHLATGAWTSVARGRYVTKPGGAHGSVGERHAVRTHAELSRFRSEAIVASHRSAAVLHGLPLLGPKPGLVEVTRDGVNGSRTSSSVQVRASKVPPEDRVRIDGTAVTSVARTLVDLARHDEPLQAIAAADRALATERVTGSEVAAAMARLGSAPGLPAARRVLQRADGRAHSVGETRQRIVLEDGGITGLAFQIEIRDDHGGFIGRTDAGLVELGILIEFDGKEKYTKYLRPGERMSDAVLREKKREDALRALGWMVLRFDWSDLRRPDDVVQRVGQEIEHRQEARLPRGSVMVADPVRITF